MRALIFCVFLWSFSAAGDPFNRIQVNLVYKYVGGVCIDFKKPVPTYHTNLYFRVIVQDVIGIEAEAANMETEIVFSENLQTFDNEYTGYLSEWNGVWLRSCFTAENLNPFDTVLRIEYQSDQIEKTSYVLTTKFYLH